MIDSSNLDQPCNAIAIAPDGSSVAIGNDFGTIHFLPLDGSANANMAKPIMTIAGNGSPVRALAFAPEGRTLAVGGDDDVVRIYAVTSREAAKP